MPSTSVSYIKFEMLEKSIPDTSTKIKPMMNNSTLAGLNRMLTPPISFTSIEVTDWRRLLSTVLISRLSVTVTVALIFLFLQYSSEYIIRSSAYNSGAMTLHRRFFRF